MAIFRSMQGTTRRGFCSKNNNARSHPFAGKCQGPVLPSGKHNREPLPQVDDCYLRGMQTKTASEQWGRMPDKAMQGRNFEEKKITVQLLLADLKACSRTQDLPRGKKVHAVAVACGHDSNIRVSSTLVRMYGKCRSMVDARRVFDTIQKPDVVSWTALLLGYAENGDGLVCLDLFSRMKASGCAPDPVTYIAALKACTSLAVDGDGKRNCLEWGREIHKEIGSNMDLYIQSTLVDMYAKCSSIGDARLVFDSIEKPNVVCWNALLSGYAENGEGLVVLDMFSRMRASGCAPDFVTYLAALRACGMIGALAFGRRLHSEITVFNTRVVTCLVDFYGKCGSMVEAHQLFDLHRKARDITTWNALLTGYGRFGDCDSVFNLFEAMQDDGFWPDAVTYVCMLSCCSHAGLVQKAREYFEEMDVRYGVTADVRHYNCMIDVLGRANLLNEAVALLRKMPCNPNAVTWTALMGACRKWKIGRKAFQSLMGKDEKIAAAHVLMAQVYGSKGTWVEQVKAFETRTDTGAWKVPEQVYVLNEVGKMVKFAVGEQGSQEVEQKLQQLCKNMKEHGYVAESYSMSCTASEVEKEKALLCGHSERRAVVYGILNTPSGDPVRVFKNTRVCDECHSSTKVISKLSGRVLVVRDSSRFHVMVNGNCSCGDSW